jgi:hypothetical protein
MLKELYIRDLIDLKSYLNNADTTSFISQIGSADFSGLQFRKYLETTLDNLFSVSTGDSEVNSYSEFLDAFINAIFQFYSKEQTFQYCTAGYLFEFDQIEFKDSLNNYIDDLIESCQLIGANGSAIISMTSSLPLTARESLTIDNLVYDTEVIPGSINSVLVSIRNSSLVQIENLVLRGLDGDHVSFLPSAKQYELSSLMPGEVATVEFKINGPSIGYEDMFLIEISKDSIVLAEAFGFLTAAVPSDNSAPISIKSGLWSDPTTWSTGLVPDATSAVIIRHEVTIDVDATCKSIKAENPAQVQVAAGKKLTILE